GPGPDLGADLPGHRDRQTHRVHTDAGCGRQAHFGGADHRGVCGRGRRLPARVHPPGHLHPAGRWAADARDGLEGAARCGQWSARLRGAALKKSDRLFNALGDPTRRAIVDKLVRGPSTVSRLAAPLEITITAVRQHLDVLEACGLVRTEKVGRVRTCSFETK